MFQFAPPSLPDGICDILPSADTITSFTNTTLSNLTFPITAFDFAQGLSTAATQCPLPAHFYDHLYLHDILNFIIGVYNGAKMGVMVMFTLLLVLDVVRLLVWGVKGVYNGVVEGWREYQEKQLRLHYWRLSGFKPSELDINAHPIRTMTIDSTRGYAPWPLPSDSATTPDEACPYISPSVELLGPHDMMSSTFHFGAYWERPGNFDFRNSPEDMIWELARWEREGGGWRIGEPRFLDMDVEEVVRGREFVAGRWMDPLWGRGRGGFAAG